MQLGTSRPDNRLAIYSLACQLLEERPWKCGLFIWGYEEWLIPANNFLLQTGKGPCKVLLFLMLEKLFTAHQKSARDPLVGPSHSLGNSVLKELAINKAERGREERCPFPGCNAPSGQRACQPPPPRPLTFQDRILQWKKSRATGSGTSAVTQPVSCTAKKPPAPWHGWV